MSLNVFAKFVKALRTKARFQIPTHRGFVSGSVEDLYDVKVIHLKTMAEKIYQGLRNTQDTLYGTSKADPVEEMKLEILKFIISEKESEAEKQNSEREKALEKQKWLQRLAKKEDEEEESLSKEEILAKLEELEN